MEHTLWGFHFNYLIESPHSCIFLSRKKDASLFSKVKHNLSTLNINQPSLPIMRRLQF